MFEWISHNRELFLVNYTQIGHNHKMSQELQTEHGQFAVNSMVSCMSITAAAATTTTTTCFHCMTNSNISTL